MSSDLYIVAKLQVPDSLRDEFLAVTRELIPASEKEDGNIFYTLNEKTDAPGTFCFIEHWKSQEAIDIHGKTEHFLKFARFAKDKSIAITMDLVKPV